MSHTNTCEKCGLEMPVPERYFGRTLKCKKCNEEFLAGPPPEPEESDEKACPYCAETIKAAAVVCRFCNRDLGSGTDSAPTRPAPKGDPDQLGIFLMIPWFAGAAAIYFIVWQSPRFMASSRFGMVVLATLTAAAILTAIDASKVMAATGEPVGDQSAGMWAIAVVLLAVIVAPLYTYKRGKAEGFSSRYTALVLLGVLVFGGMCGITANLL